MNHIIYGNACRLLRDRGFNPPINACSEPFLAMSKINNYEIAKLAVIARLKAGEPDAEKELKQMIIMQHEIMDKCIKTFKELFPRNRILFYDESGSIAIAVTLDTKFTKDVIENYHREAVRTHPKLQQMIFVYRGNKKKKINIGNVSITFMEDWELKFDPNLHVLVPHHQLVLPRDLPGLDVKNLPRVRPDERIVRWFGGKPGMVMKIIRHNVPNNIQEIMYRLISV